MADPTPTPADLDALDALREAAHLNVPWTVEERPPATVRTRPGASKAERALAAVAAFTAPEAEILDQEGRGTVAEVLVVKDARFVAALVNAYPGIAAAHRRALAELEAVTAALGHGADETLWPPGMTRGEAVARLVAVVRQYDAAVSKAGEWGALVAASVEQAQHLVSLAQERDDLRSRLATAEADAAVLRRALDAAWDHHCAGVCLPDGHPSHPEYSHSAAADAVTAAFTTTTTGAALLAELEAARADLAEVRRRGGEAVKIPLDDGAVWMAPDPEVAWRLRYGHRTDIRSPADSDHLHAAECMATLDHILRHPAGTEAIIAQLRQARRALARRAPLAPAGEER